jgi:hypothetical protein
LWLEKLRKSVLQALIGKQQQAHIAGCVQVAGAQGLRLAWLV